MLSTPSQLPYGLLRLPLGVPPLHGVTAYRLHVYQHRGLAPHGCVAWCRDGSLPFRDGLCDHSDPSTPTGSWVLHLQGLRTFHGLRPSNQDSAPVCPCPRRVILTTRQDSSSYGLITRSPPKGTSSWRFDGRISPSVGHQLQGCLVTTLAGLTPASPSQLCRDTRCSRIHGPEYCLHLPLPGSARSSPRGVLFRRGRVQFRYGLQLCFSSLRRQDLA